MPRTTIQHDTVQQRAYLRSNLRIAAEALRAAATKARGMRDRQLADSCDAVALQADDLLAIVLRKARPGIPGPTLPGKDRH